MAAVLWHFKSLNGEPWRHKNVTICFDIDRALYHSVGEECDLKSQNKNGYDPKLKASL